MSVFEQVKEVVLDKLPNAEAEKIELQTKFIEDLKADSLEIVELVMGLEDKFGVTIPDEDAEKIRTVQDAVEYIGSKQ
ncbi:MAG: acyl carrier protein [Deinococcaceae bacterium]